MTQRKHRLGTTPSLWLNVVLAFGAGWVLTACDGARPAAAPKPASPITAGAKPKSGAPHYSTELAKLNAGIARGTELAGRDPPDTLVALEVVALHLERAQLSGDYADYALANALLAKLASNGKQSAEHCQMQARLHFTLHRLNSAEAALIQCPVGVDAQAAAALRGDIAFQSGRYREAERIFRDQLNQGSLPQQHVRLALVRARTGAPAEAMALLEAAEKRYHGGSPVMIAWLRLQRGLIALDRGRLDEALALYLLADDALPGWWLIDEHRAEALHLLGRTKEAKALYESVVARTGAPEFLDALADIERDAGGTARANELRQRARALYEDRIKQFPEAAAGHALDHFLASPDDRTKAHSLAQQNFSNRPGGEAAIGLARALLANAKPAAAVKLLEAQLAAGWDSAEMHWVLSHALRQTGQPERAVAAADKARAQNPQSEKMYR